MALLTEFREELVTALRAEVTSAPVLEAPPSAVSAPAVYVRPGDPWADTPTLGATLSYRAHLQVRCLARAMDNTAALAEAEALLDEVLSALPAGVVWSDATAPTPQEIGAQGVVVAFDLTVSAHLTEGP